jgi:hypothetical protein
MVYVPNWVDIAVWPLKVTDAPTIGDPLTSVTVPERSVFEPVGFGGGF